MQGEGSESLPWRWAGELAGSTLAEPDWVWEDYLSPGTKALLAGLPKVGKTTLVADLIEAVASEAPSFLDREITGGPVVLVSEEGDVTLAPKLRALPAERVRILNRDSCWPKPVWRDLIVEATREAERIGAVLLVIDSVSFWAALEAEREKDAGATQATMDALDVACRAGLAVLLLHHQRKSPGKQGTAIRGSGALAGAVDVVIEYERLADDGAESQRRLVALSRWPQTPAVLVIDYHRQNGTWHTVGEVEGRAGSDALAIRERLLSAFPSDGSALTEDQLAGRLSLDKRKISKELRSLIGDEVARLGGGKKGDPYLYRRNAAPNAAPKQGRIADSDAAPPLMGGSIESHSAASDSASVAPRDTDRQRRSGCASHSSAPVAACRYCRAANEGAPG